MMVAPPQNYNLNKTSKRIEINNGHTLFTTVVNVTCDHLEDTFVYAIVGEYNLDFVGFYYKTATGGCEDSLTVDQTILGCKKWYLVLKASKDIKCTVTFDTRSLNDEPHA